MGSLTLSAYARPRSFSSADRKSKVDLRMLTASSLPFLSRIFFRGKFIVSLNWDLDFPATKYLSLSWSSSKNL